MNDDLENSQTFLNPSIPERTRNQVREIMQSDRNFHGTAHLQNAVVDVGFDSGSEEIKENPSRSKKESRVKRQRTHNENQRALISERSQHSNATINNQKRQHNLR